MKMWSYAGKISIIGIVFFVFYFMVFLMVDILTIVNGIQFNFLAPSIYESSIFYSILSGILFIVIILFMREEGMVKVILLGLPFIASPIRAILMISFGFYLNIIYDLIVISISAFLLLKYAVKERKKAISSSFIALFYFYIFLISIAVYIRDATAESYSFLPVAYGCYLHYGLYDYMTAIYAMILGVIGVKYALKEMKTSRDIEKEIENVEYLVKNGDYKSAIEFCKTLINIVKDKGLLERLKVYYSYSLLKLNNAEKALEIIGDVSGEYGLKGDIYLALNRINEAERSYEMAIKENGKDYVSYLNLGKIYADRGDWDNAQRLFNEAKRINKKSKIVWQNLSALEVVRGRHEEALNILKEAEKYVRE